jgi:transposase-like protein
MQLHRNAKLGLRGRLDLVLAIERGLSLKAAAAAFSVSPATAHRWWHRWRGAAADERRSLACLYDRSSRPKRCPRMLPPVSRRGSAPSGVARAGDRG